MAQILSPGKRNHRKLTAEEIKAAREQDSKMVKGVFRCFEPLGGSVSFSYRKHRGETVQNYTMKDGEIYEVPLGVAKHLNQECWYPVHSYTQDGQGIPRVDIGRRVKRMSFESLDFGDLSEATAA